MEEKDLERIERYLRQDMPATERAAFEQKLSGDPVLQREVELHTFALKAMRLEGRSALKARLRQRQMHLPDRAKRGGNRLWFWAAVLLGVALVAVLVWRWSQPSPPPGSTLSPDSLPSEAPPTPEGETPAPPFPEGETPPPLPSDTAKPAPPIAAGKPDTDKLFAANFEPYSDDVFASAVRSKSRERVEKLPPYEQFVGHYLAGEHEKALAVYEAINPAVKNSDNVQFFKANSLLALGKAGEAAEIFNHITKGRYVAEAKWYLALSLLKKGEVKNARNRLEEIAADASAARREQAQKLLKKLAD